MAKRIKKDNKIQRQFLPLDLQIFSNVKFRKARSLAINNNHNFKITDFIAIFNFYCLDAKRKRHNIDVRNIDTFELTQDGDWHTKDLESINNYLIESGLLTKKFTISSYYKWNKCDVLDGDLSIPKHEKDETQHQLSNNSAGTQQELSRKLSNRKSYLKTVQKLSESQINQDLIINDLQGRINDLSIPKQNSDKLSTTKHDLSIDLSTPLDLILKTKDNILKNKKNTKKENQQDTNEFLVTEKIDYQELFNKFWSEYPNKTGSKGSKKEAEKNFTRVLSKTKEPLVLSEKINKALMSYKEYLKVTPWLQVSHASTWINKERWDDDYSQIKPGQNTISPQNEQSYQTTQNNAQKVPLNDDDKSDNYFAYRFNEAIEPAFSYRECVELTESIEKSNPSAKKYARTIALIQWLKDKPNHELTPQIKKEIIEIYNLDGYEEFTNRNILGKQKSVWTELLELLFN